jgi:hypothetical protein
MLRGLLGEIDAGRLNASAVFRARIECLVVALGVVLGADIATVPVGAGWDARPT